MDLIKYDMTDIWAVAGDVIAPDSAKVRQGWGVEVVPRQWWNWFENRQDNNIAYMLQKGFPEWDATTEYIANKSYVQRNGVVYKSTATSTNNDPVNLTAWVRAFATYTTASNALGGTTAAADRLPYFTSATAASTTVLTAFARTLLDDADAATARTTLGAQLAHQNLAGLSGLVSTVNGVPYFTATTGAMGLATLTAYGRTLFGTADAAAARTALGLKGGAILDATAGNNDGTAGRLQTVGDYGWGVGNNGLPAMDIPSNGTAADANLATLSGVYRVATGAVNVPTGYGQGALITTIMWNNGTGTQTVQQSGRMATRYGSGLTGTATWTNWSEVWTTQNLTKTASATDTTAGSMLKVGDFGVGGNGVTPSSADLNSINASGFYNVPANAANAPLAATAVLTHTNYNSGGAGQIFYALTSGRYYMRTQFAASNWTAWVELYHTGNSQALVDQVTSGVQTKLDAKINRAGDTMAGKLTLNGGSDNLNEVTIRSPNSADSVGLSISNNAWDTHIDVLGDTWRFFANRLNNNTTLNPLAFNMSSQAAQVFGNNIWHSGNFTPGSYATTDYANSIANSTANSVVQGYAYSKAQSDAKYYVNGAGSLVINNGGIPGIAGATSDYAAQSLRIANAGNNAASAAMSFLRDGSFGTFFGLNTDNTLAWGGWSHGNRSYRIYSEKDFLIGSYSTNTQNNAYFVAQSQYDSFHRNYDVNVGAEETGQLAALGNVSGGTHGLNVLVSGNSLRRGGTNQTSGEAVPGNWRCMGVVNNGIIGLYKRYN